MLVDRKFIYLSLPRCGSTAFHLSCILNNLNVQTNDEGWTIANSKIDFTKVDKTNIMDHIYHGHESLTDLQSKFGYQYPIIAVNRDRHERFYSLYKHAIFDFKRTGEDELYEKFSKISLDELFFFKTEDLYNKRARWDKISEFLIDMGIFDEKIDVSVTSKKRKHEVDFWIKEKRAYIVNILDILITPLSFWTNNNKNIIWFEFNEFEKMEEWISSITKKPFKMEKVNSSKHINCNIELNDEFIRKYDSIYDYYDLHKKDKTLI